MAIQYDTNEERSLHFSVMHALADQYHIDESTIRAIYESKLEELKYSARINTYLPVLVERHVKSALQKSHTHGAEAAPHKGRN